MNINFENIILSLLYRYEIAKAKFESKEVKGIHLWLELTAGFKVIRLLIL